MNFSKIIRRWYAIHKRDLPWRNTSDPYRIWLSEIILQQTQVSQGLPYYDAFISSFPTVFDLANATEDQVLKLWQGLGYYSRARNLHHTSKLVVQDFNGKFPITYDELIKLKGVGDYTASAIASICNDEPTAVVDGNVYRLLSRYFGIKTPINSTAGTKEFKSLAQELLPEAKIGDHNQAIMEFGARQCKPKSPNCSICPLHDSCFAFRKRLIEVLPVKLNKQKVKKRYFNYLVMLAKNGYTLMEKRHGKGIWQNLYQFPLIESTKRLSYAELCAQIDLQSMLNGSDYEISLYNENPITHKLSHQHLITHFWIVNLEEIPDGGIPFSKIKALPVPTLISNFMEGLSIS
ncbi:MAG: A/G-specific adenine glycosylase [Bacteroidia bacterium]|nr:A/G-specific adenine glycosylase [Bacteroidia bacterium]NND25239.1 A/G-specific adenine glycosylase [Flavobacteriaceae bacterium]MBT8277497.1 A/G-specific adenine glycosylase [Bacteroidia bacterium]NNK61398.1 A/G-specific adenine glycosylase [Flavobacteriaceae bacterium]NNL32791.1 A/G-specific adenine glycosylase [Flavobacteriaceae bacterium]